MVGLRFLLVLGLLTPAWVSSAAPAAQAAAPVRSIVVSGTGVGMYPSFAKGIRRYAVTHGASAAGTVTVEATTSDSAGEVLVDGRPVDGAATTVTGLTAGDEISVIFDDAAGTRAYSLFYLPDDFPTMEQTVRKPGSSVGLVGLTLTQWGETTPNFEAVLDRNGVPVYARSIAAGADLKVAANGSFSVARIPGDGTGKSIIEYDGAFREVARYRAVRPGDTNTHDSVLLPNGHVILLANVDNATTGKQDSVVQEVNADGNLVFQWSSAGLEGETVTPSDPDYAHVNSVAVMDDGDLLVSLRNLSSVLKIARRAHDGFAKGDVVWRLGGRYSDFTFLSDPYAGGPCAQHSATALSNGHIQIFDNGSSYMCIDPDNPTGARVSRVSTRVTEYALNEVDGTARLVWSYEPGRFALFAGSATRLADGHTLVGWASEAHAVATEVGVDGGTLWELRDADAGTNPFAPFYSTYRAMPFEVPDVLRPVVRLSSPATASVFERGERVVAEYSCTDKGGSSLQTCTAPRRSGALLDTATAGRHTFAVRATDGDGNVRTVKRTYTVLPEYRPDAEVRRLPNGTWVGADQYGGSAGQTVSLGIARDGRTARAAFRLTNTGYAGDRFRVTGGRSDRLFRVRYLDAGTNVTKQVVAGTWQTGPLAPGDSVLLEIRVTRRKPASQGDARKVSLKVVSVNAAKKADVAAVRARATR